MSTLKDIAQAKLDRIKSLSLEQSMQTSAGLVKPVFVRSSFAGADVRQSAMPELLQTSWSKIFEDPRANQAAIITVFRALYLNDYDNWTLAAFNVDNVKTHLADSTLVPLQVSMIFGSFRSNIAMEETAKILEEALGEGFVISPINGGTTSNRAAEDMAKKVCVKAKREGKRVIFLSYQMASRSFSVSEIDSVILAYDKGDLGGTAQKVSRCLTPGLTFNGDKKTHGLIISLSLDANRTEIDPIDQYFIDQAKKSDNVEDGLQAPLRRLAKAFNIFQSSPLSIDPMEPEDFVKELFSGGKMEKIFPSLVNDKSIDKAVDELGDIFSGMSLFDIAALEGVKSVEDLNKKVVDVSKAKKYLDSLAPRAKRGDKEEMDIREALIKASQRVGLALPNAYIFSEDAGVNNVDDVITYINSAEDIAADFEEEFSIPPVLFLLVFERGILSKRLANSVISQIKDKKAAKQEYYKGLSQKSAEDIAQEFGF